MTDAKGSAIGICICTCKYTQLRPANSIPNVYSQQRVGGH